MTILGAGVFSTTPSDQARFHLAAIVDSSNDAIVSKDLNGFVTSWNKAAEAMFGYSAAEIIGRPILLIVPANRVAEEATILDRVRGGERLVHFETKRQRKDAIVFPVSLTVSPILDDAGAIVGASKIARDLSEIQRAHNDLARRESLLNAILDAEPDALIVIDQQGLIQSFSSGAVRMFGFTPDEIIGQNVKRLMPAPYRDEHDGNLRRYAATGERHIIGIGRVIVGQHKDGGTFPMELTVGEVSLPGTRLFAGFVRDLTNRHDRERRINELQAELLHVARVAELGQMVAALAHEVNQPLTAMAAYLSGIRRLLAAGKQEAMAPIIERIAEQAARAQQIVRRLRDQVSKRATERQVERLPAIIEEASGLALLGIGQGIRLTTRMDEAAAEAVIDKIQIQQVLLNLMRNAAEAMAGSARRELIIATLGAGDRIEISVADTGPGLPETVRDRLFEPFVTTKRDGMGIGLSVCRTIVEAHGGELRAESGADGGTVFRFTVPRHLAAMPT